MYALVELMRSRCFLKVRPICSQYLTCILHTKINPFEYNSFRKKLVDLGLSETCATDIASNDAFHPFMENKLNQTLNVLTRLQFGSDLLTKLINAHPLLLLVSASTIERTCDKLLASFTKKYVFYILLSSPEVLNEEWEVTSDKLKYLQEQMYVSNLDIVSNGILKHSLDHIKLRHEFLKRTGRYKKLNPKLTSSEKHKLNPLIQDIMNTTPEHFSVKVAGVTNLEFDIFQQMYFECDEEGA